MSKTRLNLSLDQDLINFIKLFAEENRMTVADIITQYLLSLKRRVEGGAAVKILAHPAFQEAMKEAQAKLRNGKAEWHTFDEVFED